MKRLVPAESRTEETAPSRARPVRAAPRASAVQLAVRHPRSAVLPGSVAPQAPAGHLGAGGLQALAGRPGAVALQALAAHPGAVAPPHRVARRWAAFLPRVRFRLAAVA